MKKLLIITSFLSNIVIVFSQNKEIEEGIKELSNTPSVMLLGLSSSDLETPKSKKAFMTNIVNTFSKNEGLPNAYAVEITPTYLFSTTISKPLEVAGVRKDKNNNYRNSIFSDAKNVSFSFAFLKNYEIENITSENLSVSFSLRTTLLKIRSKKDVKNIGESNDIIDDQLELIRNEWQNSDQFNTLLAANAKPKEFQEAENEYNKAKSNASKKIYDEAEKYKKYLDEKPMFQLDLASAYSTFFLDNQFKNNQFGKLGFWITMSSGIELEKKDGASDSKIEKRLNFYGIARYLQDRTVYDVASGFGKTNNYDFGGKIELVYNKFSIGYEFIYRNNSVDNTYRSNGILNYKVSDNVYLNAAFGKNYGNENNLISFLGLSWGLDSKRKVIFPEVK